MDFDYFINAAIERESDLLDDFYYPGLCEPYSKWNRTEYRRHGRFKRINIKPR